MSSSPTPQSNATDTAAKGEARSGAPSISATPLRQHPRTAEHAALARRTLLQAALLGVLADALLRDGPANLGLLIWMLAFAAGVVALAWRRGTRFGREQCAWLGVAILLAAGSVWRNAEELQVFDLLAILVALALLGATTSAASPLRSLLGARVRDLALAFARVAADAAAGIIALLFVDSELGTVGRQVPGHRARAVLRAALLTIPLLIVFGALLREADPVFGSLLALPHVDFEVIVSHIFVAWVFTWITGGWMRGALVDTRSRSRAPDGFPIALGSLEITIALGALTALFLLFVGVQITWLFGGEALVQRTTGLGYAAYARRGFFELVWVSLLVLPVLLGTRAAIAPADDLAVRRHRQLSIPLLALLGAIMLSALGRMRLYVEYYGLTTDRLFATVFMVWLAVVFVWFALTVLRGRERDFAAGMTITGLMTLLALNAANPEALIARVNVARAPGALAFADTTPADLSIQTTRIGTRRSPIDYSYLTRSLRGDATPIVVRALLAPPVSPTATLARMDEVKARCNAVRALLERWDPPLKDAAERGTRQSWRTWNFGAARARAVVRSNEDSLRGVTCWDSGGEIPFGTREQRAALPGEQWYGQSDSGR